MCDTSVLLLVNMGIVKVGVWEECWTLKLQHKAYFELLH